MAILVAAAAVQLPTCAVGRTLSVRHTSAPPVRAAGTANIFVSSGGNDSCTRSATSIGLARANRHICRTPVRACQIARSGDTIIIEDGTYDGDMDACHGHENYAQNVVLEPEPGHECPMTYPNVPAPFSDLRCGVNLTANSTQAGLSLGGNAGLSCGVTGSPLPHTLSAAQRSTWINHLTIKGINVGDMSAICAAYIELRNDVGNHFYIGEGAYRFFILGGDYGNRADGQQPTIGDTICGCSNWPPAEDVRIVSAVVHDFITRGASHGDGIFVQPSYDVRIEKNVLARNDCIPIYINYATSYGQPVGVHGLRVIGNVVHAETVHDGGDKCGQSISLGNNDQTDTIVAFNSIEGPIRRSNSTEVNQNIRIVGNIADEIDATDSGNVAGCGAGTTAAYNVLTNTRARRCGDLSNIVVAGSQFVSRDAQPNSPADGHQSFAAPLGNYTLARRAKAVRKVPARWCKANPGVCPKADILGNPRPNPAHPSYYDAGAYENR